MRQTPQRQASPKGTNMNSRWWNLRKRKSRKESGPEGDDLVLVNPFGVGWVIDPGDPQVKTCGYSRSTPVRGRKEPESPRSGRRPLAHGEPSVGTYLAREGCSPAGAMSGRNSNAPWDSCKKSVPVTSRTPPPHGAGKLFRALSSHGWFAVGYKTAPLRGWRTGHEAGPHVQEHHA